MNKRILYILTITLFFNQLFAQTQSGYLPFHDYLIKQHGDIQHQHGVARNVVFKQIGYLHLTYGTSWNFADSGQFNYNQQGIETGGAYSTYVNATTGWKDSSWFTCYNNGSALDSILGKNADSTNNYLHTFAYYTTAPIGYLNTETLQKANGSNWTDSVAYTYTYDGNNNNMLSTLTAQYNSGGSLQNDSQYVYTFNGYNNIQTVIKVWQGGAWVNAFNQYNNFDANGNNIQSFGYVWNNGNWVNYNQVIRGYDGYNNQVSYIEQVYNPAANGGLGGYVNQYSETYQYVLGNNTQFENYTWDSATTSWTPGVMYVFSYDNYNNPVFEFDAKYNNGQWDSTDMYYYTYSAFVVSGVNEVVGNTALSIYPNPVANATSVYYNCDKGGELNFKLTDMPGRTIKQYTYTANNGANKIVLNLAGIAAGNYLLQITDDTGKVVDVKKLVKE